MYLSGVKCTCIIWLRLYAGEFTVFFSCVYVGQPPLEICPIPSIYASSKIENVI